MPGLQVVWFTRDLRVADHAPLLHASRSGPTLGLYVYDPRLVGADDFDPSHLVFINQSLSELRERLHALGGRLLVRRGPTVKVLDEIQRQQPIEALWSHQQTGTLLIGERNQEVCRWAARHQVMWNELPQNGVIRGLESRDGWSKLWTRRMVEPLSPEPKRVESPIHMALGEILAPRELGLPESSRTGVQIGGESVGRGFLDSFLESRGKNYRSEMSSPVTAASSCSRLSPYLAWGNLSIRQVYQATERRRAEAQDSPWKQSLAAFRSRLSWHCHFMQKLEDQPDLEIRNMSRACDGLREDEFDHERFAAWCDGRTGYPMVDACMRALHQHGWINFRMRAMLVSFACYHLWLHWVPVARYLSKLFLDYEPGIHYPQTQMQAGVTGINTVRIYSPIKQVKDHDPTGIFIRRYVPELAQAPDEFLAEPHQWNTSTGYPSPIVHHETVYREARRRMYQLRAKNSTKEAARATYQKHGSRKRPRRARAGRAT